MPTHDTNNEPLLPSNGRRLPAALEKLLTAGPESHLELIAHHARLALIFAEALLEDEVEQLAGAHYSRQKPHDGRFSRWGSNPGSVRIGRERVPVAVPRVRDTAHDEERPLECYAALREGTAYDDGLEEALLLGLSTRDYGRVTRAFMDGFGLSQSSVSRAFQERSRQALEAFESRSLADEDILALWLDGKSLARHQMVICLALTMDGRKLPVGFIESTTENASAVRGLLQDLLRRGLTFDQGLLCVVDGAKGLSAAVREVFGHHAVLQRCQWHKRENVISYLPEKDQSIWRARIQAAYNQPTYEKARAELRALHAELLLINRSAANSLKEGLEETLTLHRLGVFVEVGRSLKTTNPIENLNSQLAKYIGRVKHWMSSDQCQRYIAMSLMEIEGRMRKMSGYEQLPLLRNALHEHLRQQQDKHPSEPLPAAKNFN